MNRKYISAIALLVFMTTFVNSQAQNQRPQITPEQAEAFRKAADERLRKDWAFLKKYDAQNAKLLASSSKTNGPVYMGDSITEFWWRYDSAFWKNNAYIDRGISGQTSSQMLVRFRQDVVDLHPSLVLINAGTNDIAENTGPISLERVFGNIVSMVEIAEANDIRVVLSSVLPANVFSWNTALQPADKIIKLNSMIKEYAAQHKLAYVDYWTAMVDNANGLDPKYTFDGVHPTLVGYQVMEPLAKKAIDETLKKGKSKKR